MTHADIDFAGALEKLNDMSEDHWKIYSNLMVHLTESEWKATCAALTLAAELQGCSKLWAIYNAGAKSFSIADTDHPTLLADTALLAQAAQEKRKLREALKGTLMIVETAITNGLFAPLKPDSAITRTFINAKQTLSEIGEG